MRLVRNLHPARCEDTSAIASWGGTPWTIATIVILAIGLRSSPLSAQDDGDGTGGDGQETSGVFDAPTGLTPCQVEYGNQPVVRLSWENPEAFEQIVVLIDGEPAQAWIDGSFRIAEIPVSVGEHELGVRGAVGEFTSKTATTPFAVLAESPVKEPVTDLVCEFVPGGGGALEISWNRGPDAWVLGEVRLSGRRGGNVEFGGDADSVRVPLEGERPAEAVVAYKNEDGYFSEPIEVPCLQLVPAFRRGDCDGSGIINISDAIFQVNHLFQGQNRWLCDDACDSNDDSTVDLSDALTTLGYLFRGEGETPSPGPLVCGIDPTDDFLGGLCERSCP
jgi:hypothetical protein